MIPRLTFREWSICVSLGEAGIEMIHARRNMRRAIASALREIRDDMLHGIGIYRTTVSMGEGCTPLFRRIDPADVYVDRMIR